MLKINYTLRGIIIPDKNTFTTSLCHHSPYNYIWELDSRRVTIHNTGCTHFTQSYIPDLYTIALPLPTYQSIRDIHSKSVSTSGTDFQEKLRKQGRLAWGMGRESWGDGVSYRFSPIYCGVNNCIEPLCWLESLNPIVYIQSTLLQILCNEKLYNRNIEYLVFNKYEVTYI